jgi:3-oxoacyl-[acyl-carrier-protein] synthase II
VTPRAITGFGVVSALGIGRAAFNEALASGKPPARPLAITAFDATAYPDADVAEVPDFDAARFLGDKGLRSLDRQTKLLVVAARLCLQDALLKKDGVFVASSPERVGLCASNAYGSLEAITELDRVAVLEDARYINPAKFPNTVANSASGYVSIWEDLHALNVAVSDGNCGALDTLTCADVYLDTGRADAILVGGGEALSEALYLAFRRLGSLTSGTRLGEGAALFVLETTESAKARGAKVDAMLLGTGTSFVAPAHEGSLLHASPEAMERAVTSALSDAGIGAGAVDLVVSGVSRSGAFADAELGGIARVLGERVPVAAPKAVLGETLGASGAMGMGAAITWMGGVPVSTLVRGEAPAKVRTVVVTSVGFYGNATAAVLGGV